MGAEARINAAQGGDTREESRAFACPGSGTAGTKGNNWRVAAPTFPTTRLGRTGGWAGPHPLPLPRAPCAARFTAARPPNGSAIWGTQLELIPGREEDRELYRQCREHPLPIHFSRAASRGRPAGAGGQPVKQTGKMPPATGAAATEEPCDSIPRRRGTTTRDNGSRGPNDRRHESRDHGEGRGLLAQAEFSENRCGLLVGAWDVLTSPGSSTTSTASTTTIVLSTQHPRQAQLSLQVQVGDSAMQGQTPTRQRTSSR